MAALAVATLLAVSGPAQAAPVQITLTTGDLPVYYSDGLLQDVLNIVITNVIWAREGSVQVLGDDDTVLSDLISFINIANQANIWVSDDTSAWGGGGGGGGGAGGGLGLLGQLSPGDSITLPTILNDDSGAPGPDIQITIGSLHLDQLRVPLPASLAMVGVGLLGLALARRRGGTTGRQQ
jgi:hypothetical protein